MAQEELKRKLAARLEVIADPGGICISRTAFDQIEDKLPLGYEYLGGKAIKISPNPFVHTKLYSSLPGKSMAF